MNFVANKFIDSDKQM